MNLKNFSKVSQRALARWGLYLFVWIYKWFPFSWVRIQIKVLVAIGFRLTGRQRMIAEESLNIAFAQEKSQDEIQKIIRHNFDNLGKGIVELIYYLSHRESVLDIIQIEGQEHLDAAIQEGNGVIAVTAHYGNFPLMMLGLAAAGYPSNTIIRPARDEKLEKYLYRKRKDLGLNTIYAIPRHTAAAQSLKALRNNEVLFIPLDQNFGNTAGVFVDFFGQKAATATGPVVLARRSKAKILMMFILRQEDDTHKLIIHPEFQIEERDNEEDMLVHNIGRMTNIIEDYIRKYPYEWGWMHRRWKSRPSKFNKGLINT